MESVGRAVTGLLGGGERPSLASDRTARPATAAAARTTGPSAPSEARTGPRFLG